MVRRLILCSITSAGLLYGFSNSASAQVQPISLNNQPAEDLFDNVLVKPAPKPKSTGSPATTNASTGAQPQAFPQLFQVAAGEEATPLAGAGPAPMAPQFCAPFGCLPPSPFVPGMAPPIDPGSSTPGLITPPPSPTEPSEPSSPPSFDPGQFAQQPSNIPNTNASPFDFSSNFSSQNLLASRDVPAMIGDFFGSGQSQTICIQPESFLFQGASVQVPWQTGYYIRNFSDINGFGNTEGFDVFVPGPFGSDRYVEFDVDVMSNAAGGGDIPINPTTFRTVDPNPDVSPGSPWQLTSPLVNPGTPPTPGSFVAIEQTNNQTQIQAQALADQHGFQQQKDDYIAANGPGTLVDSGPGSVTIGPGYAIMRDVAGPLNGYEDQYYVQQLESYTPDPSTFTPDPYLVTPDPICIDIIGESVAAMPGASVGRMKLTENTSPIPRDRVYINYSYFDNTPLFPGGVNVNRVTPGIEKTFMGGNMSIELRTPFATTLDSDIFTGGITNTNDTQFGNLTTYLKALLWENEAWALSAGVGAAVPTADDVNIFDAQTGNRLIGVKNNSVHLLPFVGGAYIPNNRLFVQSILQFDIDLNGNPISATSFDQGLPTGELSRIGNGRDQTFLYYDISIGYWIPTYIGGITRVAPILEYHLNQSIQDGTDVSGQAGNTIYNFAGASGTSVSNGVVGLVASINDKATMTVAYATPLGGSDQQFDGEVRVMFNWFFGGNSPLRYGPALR